MLNVGTLGPVVALAAWTMVMWIWMYATRFPAMTKAGVDPEKLSRENTASGLDAALPPEVQWKAHNYNHLHEAPTVFYAISIVLAIIGQGDGHVVPSARFHLFQVAGPDLHADAWEAQQNQLRDEEP